jgi:UDP-3-O-[3-hydroxymyristoyl] glucosamine N-acyltransferase
MKLSELADQTGARVEGIDVDITGAAGLDEASEGHVTFLANPKYTPRVNTTSASAIYLSEDVKTEKRISILRVKDPYLAYTRALRIFYPEKTAAPFIHPTAVIDLSELQRCLYCCVSRDWSKRRDCRRRLYSS